MGEFLLLKGIDLQLLLQLLNLFAHKLQLLVQLIG